MDLIVASQIIDSKGLYEEGLQGLINSQAELDLVQSARIGTDAMHSILMAAYVKIKDAKKGELRAQTSPKEFQNPRCANCHSVMYQACYNCN